MPDLEEIVIAACKTEREARAKKRKPFVELVDDRVMEMSEKTNDLSNLGWVQEHLRFCGSRDADRVLFSMVSIGRAIQSIAEDLKGDLELLEMRCKGEADQ